MAHTLNKLTQIAQAGLAALAEQGQVFPLLSRDFQSDLLVRGKGSTVTVNIPGVFQAKDFDHATGIEVQDITETTTEVKLDKILDVSFELTDSEFRLDVVDLASQFIVPAMNALAEGADAYALATLADAATTEVGTGTETARPYAYSHPKVLIDAKAKLDTARAPESQRFAIIGTETAADWLSTDLLTRADHSGTTQGLRNANIGNLFGFDLYQNTRIAAPGESPSSGEPTTEVSVAAHRNAVAFAAGTLEAAANTESVVVNHKGLALRLTRFYDGVHKKSVLSADVLLGANPVRPEWITLIKGADAE